MERFLKFKEVAEMVRLSRSSIYQYVSDGRFPKPIKVGERAVAFLESEIKAWMDDKMRSRK